MTVDAISLNAALERAEPQAKGLEPERSLTQRGWSGVFLTTCGLFVLLASALFYTTATEMRPPLEGAGKERVGIHYLRHLLQLGWALEAYHASLLGRAPPDGGGPSGARLGRAVEDRIQALDGPHAHLGEALGMAKSWDQAVAEWGKLTATAAESDAQARRTAASAFLARVMALVHEAAGRSGLAHGPDRHAQYLQGLLSRAVPTAMQEVVAFRELALLWPPKGPSGEGAHRQLVRMGVKLAALGEALQAELERAAAIDSGHPGSLAAITPKVEAAAVALAELAALAPEPSQRAHGGERRPEPPAPASAREAQVWMDASARGLDTLKAVSQQSASLLERAAKGRIAALRSALRQRLALGATLSLMVAFSLYALRRAHKAGLAARDRELRRTALEHQRGQRAILQLMDELAEVASGNLAARASVTTEITGSIADSINVTIEALREVVEAIDAASREVNASTDRGRAVANALAVAATDQSERIKQTSGSIDTMARSISEVSDSANRCADVAMLSLDAAARGADAVRDAIKNMDGIRGQIQQTAKRIKRLGERSQEIGDIVNLIDTLAEQTNVLALNAAIQAAAAGSAGRGFAIVAEEVQRLAERSANATREVAARVKAIQADTHDAVVAMEQSTDQVVEGTRLSIAVNKALLDIQNVTPRLASLVQSISVATQSQTEIAAQVSDEMGQILELNEKTTAGASQIVTSIAALADTVRKLRASVTRFHL